MRTAHIIMTPDVEVGDKVLAACGKKHKVRYLWDDVPEGTPTCRPCVDALLHAVNEVNDLVSDAMRGSFLLVSKAERIFDTLTRPNGMTLMIEAASLYADERAEKAAKKAEAPALKCICLWTSPTEGEPASERVLQLGCPVHDADPEGSDSELVEEGEA